MTAAWFGRVSSDAAANESEETGAVDRSEETTAVWPGGLELDAGEGSGLEAVAAKCSDGAVLGFDSCESEIKSCSLALLSTGCTVERVLLLVKTFADKCCEVAAENIGLHSPNAALRSSTSSQSAT